MFYDINLEVDSYLPHASNSASDINESTSNANSISHLTEKSTKNSKKVENGENYSLSDVADGDMGATTCEVMTLLTLGTIWHR